MYTDVYWDSLSIIFKKLNTELLIGTPCLLFKNNPDTEMYIRTPCVLFLKNSDTEMHRERKRRGKPQMYTTDLPIN